MRFSTSYRALDELFGDRAALESLLGAHLARGVHLSPTLASFATLRALDGRELRTRARSGRIVVTLTGGEDDNDDNNSNNEEAEDSPPSPHPRARIEEGDLLTANGVVHAIDRVLL